jgi:hypothetical protein
LSRFQALAASSNNSRVDLIIPYPCGEFHQIAHILPEFYQTRLKGHRFKSNPAAH